MKYLNTATGHGWNFLGAPNSGKQIYIFIFCIKILGTAVERILYHILYPSIKYWKKKSDQIKTLRLRLRPVCPCYQHWSMEDNSIDLFTFPFVSDHLQKKVSSAFNTPLQKNAWSSIMNLQERPTLKRRKAYVQLDLVLYKLVNHEFFCCWLLFCL